MSLITSKYKPKRYQQINYMDVKYLSECIEMERRHVRLKIFDYRQSINKNNTNFISNFSSWNNIISSFSRYAYITRLYHKTRKEYLKQLENL